MLVQHILELFLGAASKSDKLKSEPIILLPANNGKGDDHRRTSLRSLHMQIQTGSNGKQNRALEFTSGKCKISHRSVA